MSTDSSTADLAPTDPDLPLAFDAPFPVGGVNQRIDLAIGPVRYSRGTTTAEVESSIFLDWLPSPTVRLQAVDIPHEEVQGFEVFKSIFNGLGEVDLQLPDGTAIPGQTLYIEKLSNLDNGGRVSWGGHIHGRVTRPAPAPVLRVEFLLPNFADVLGWPIQYPNGACSASRSVLRASGWHLVLDEMADCKKVQQELRAKSGFGVTHVGRLVRDDDRLFSTEDAADMMEALAYFFTFAVGRWTGPCLPVGFDDGGRRLWESWTFPRIEPVRFRRSWLQTQGETSLSAPFAGFMARWADPIWQPVIRTAIHWHTEANAQAGSIEGAIILAQTAFELLASVILVETEFWVSSDGYEKLAADDRIRLLFRWAGIPTQIPVDFPDLVALARAENWADLPRAMTGVRNPLTHPTKKNRDRFDRLMTAQTRSAVWMLSLWGLELCLLRLFDYRGKYSCRFRQRHAWQAEDVPWA